MKKRKSMLFIAVITIATGISVFLYVFPKWLMDATGSHTTSQLLSRFDSISFTSKHFISTTAIYLLIVAGITVLLVSIFCFVLKKAKFNDVAKLSGISIVVLSLLVVSIFHVRSTVVKTETQAAVVEPDIKQEELVIEFEPHSYVIPSSDIITFPKQKKNVILIYLESFESTFLSKELGGAVDYNLIPNLTSELDKETSVSFSHSDKLGGTYQAPYTGFSIAGMFATQSGLPFKTPIDGNQYGTVYDFAPGAITLGDILEYEGYNLEFLVGADGEFAGVSNFYESHGNWNVLDHKKAIEEGKIPSDYNVWWGYEDSKLYDYAKETLDEVSKKDGPFAMILETDDTHFPDGYLDASCPAPYSEPYENAINCTDIMVSDFIEYVKQQDYYKDTIIVVHGDHLSMEKPYFERNVDEEYNRTIFNAYYNVDKNLVKSANTKNREMTTMDVFPTILSAMNVKIDGERLGYGTNLFSNIPTIYEAFGMEKPNEEYIREDEDYIKDIMLDQRTYE